MTHRSLLLSAWILCSASLAASAQVLEGTPIGDFMRAQGMVAIPTAWQAYVAPGSFISAVLGQFAPEVQVGHGSRIDYGQTEFGFKVYDGTQASAAFRDSAKTQSDVLSDFYSARDRHGLPVFLHFGKGYFF